MALAPRFVTFALLAFAANFLELAIAAPSNRLILDGDRRSLGSPPRDLKRSHSQPSPRCDSLLGFCADFTQACLGACIDQHAPHGFSRTTAVAYNCASAGSGSYDFGCSCGGDDLTSTVLNQIASPHSGTTPTDTVTVTKTLTATVSTAVVSEGETVVITSMIPITAPTVFTSVPELIRITSGVTTLFSTTIITVFSTPRPVTVSSLSLAPSPRPPATPRLRRRAAGDFCDVYKSSCSTLCGPNSVRQSTCSSSHPDHYSLQCKCKNGQDRTSDALYPVDQACGGDGGTGPATATVTVTKGVVATVVDTVTETDIIPVTATITPIVTVPVPTTVVIPASTVRTAVTKLTAIGQTSTVVKLISPTGKILVTPANSAPGYISNTFSDDEPGAFGLATAPTDGLTVVLAEGGAGGSIYVIPTDGPFTHAYLGGTYSGDTEPLDPGSSVSVVFSLVDYAARGPPSDTLGNSWADADHSPSGSETTFFTINRSNFTMSLSWVQPDGSTFAARGEYSSSNDLLSFDGGLPDPLESPSTFKFVPLV